MFTVDSHCCATEFKTRKSLVQREQLELDSCSSVVVLIFCQTTNEIQYVPQQNTLKNSRRPELRGRSDKRKLRFPAKNMPHVITKEIVIFRCVLIISSSGGCPYPRKDGRKIAEMLQRGYRMPKPQHLDDELYVNMRAYCICYIRVSFFNGLN